MPWLLHTLSGIALWPSRFLDFCTGDSMCLIAKLSAELMVRGIRGLFLGVDVEGSLRGRWVAVFRFMQLVM
eukprot:1931354-Amphidinium_carterae.3